MRPVRRIVIHCTASDDTRGLNFDAVRRYHVDQRGWLDIGYQMLIEKVDGVVITIMGRPWHMDGAHAAQDGANHDSLAIAVVHNGRDAPPDDLWMEAVIRAADLCKVFGLDPEMVVGHRELGADKACPGELWDMNRFRCDVRREMEAP